MQLITISHLDDSTPWSFFCPVTGSQLFGEDGPEAEPKSVGCSRSNDLGFEAEQFSPELETAWKASFKTLPDSYLAYGVTCVDKDAKETVNLHLFEQANTSPNRN